MIKGKVKWFNNEKGFGFIYTDKLDDHFFSVKDINGFDLPNIGDVVEFETNSGKKGLFATKINIISPKENEDKITCAGCKEQIKPITVHNPRKKVLIRGKDGERPISPYKMKMYGDYNHLEWQNAYVSGNCPLCGYEIWKN